MSTNPFTLEKQPDGKVHIKYETGEEFTGDPLEVTQKIAEAHVNTKKWAQGIKQENDTLKAHPSEPKKNDPPAPATDPNEAQLQNYLVEQWAKGLGFKDAIEAKKRIGSWGETTDKIKDQIIIQDFMTLCPDFPGTPASVDAMSKKLDELGAEFNPVDMTAAHALCIKEGLYKALTAEEQSQGWQDRMNQANNQQRTAGTPPPPPPSGSPDTNQTPENEYNMSLDKLRQQILERNAKGERAIGGNLENV